MIAECNLNVDCISVHGTPYICAEYGLEIVEILIHTLQSFVTQVKRNTLKSRTLAMLLFKTSAQREIMQPKTGSGAS